PTVPGPLKLHGLSVEGVNQCVHCGLCLAYCPTFSELGTEMDSPRGRIFLIKSLAEGRVALTDSVVEHLPLCLDCRACETVCPAGRGAALATAGGCRRPPAAATSHGRRGRAARAGCFAEWLRAVDRLRRPPRRGRAGGESKRVAGGRARRAGMLRPAQRPRG